MDFNSLSLFAAMQSFITSGHQLGSIISEGEAGTLVESLRRRLDPQIHELDLSVRSLERLDSLLIAYIVRLGHDLPDLGVEDAAVLLREVAAYIGKTFVSHSAGQWETGETFFVTAIVYKFSTKGEPLNPYRNELHILWRLAELCLRNASHGEYTRLDKVLRKEQSRQPRKSKP